MNAPMLVEALKSSGYALAPKVLAAREVAVAAQALERGRCARAGTRNLLDLAWCRALVNRVRARLQLADALPTSSVAVQCTLFDKTPERNWLVAIHQDLSIPVRSRVHHLRLGGWSRKEGVVFVQAPAELLQRLLAVRIHIDDCGPENGPLRCVPGSHRQGRISDAAARQVRVAAGEVVCVADRGDALLMRPLLLHASSKALAPTRRRVLHILFGPASLPFGLEWQRAV